MPDEAKANGPQQAQGRWGGMLAHYWPSAESVQDEHNGEAPAGHDSARARLSGLFNRLYTQAPAAIAARSDVAARIQQAVVKAGEAPSVPPGAAPVQNHVLPYFDDCFVAARGGLGGRLRTISSYLWPSVPRPLSLRAEPVCVRRAVVVGVHGYFPIKLVQQLVGRPRGTSERLASRAQAALGAWVGDHKRSDELLDVHVIALTADGRVAERVDLFWQTLLEHRDAIAEADYIFFAAHSQGSPVAVHLAARCFHENWVRDEARLSVLCMAGIHLGAMPRLEDKYIMRAYGVMERQVSNEIYDFQRPESLVSRAYADAVKECLKHGNFRLTLAGSIDDQVVPLYSSMFATLQHPCVHRVLFLDGRIHKHDFLARLIALVLKLREAGGQDYGIMEQLSAPLAGNLYAGEGHSTLYDEEMVYVQAIRHALETDTPSIPTPCVVQEEQLGVDANPYVLPWAVNSLLNDPMVRGSFHKDIAGLRQEFEAWTPTTRTGRDIRYRLEAIKARI